MFTTKQYLKTASLAAASILLGGSLAAPTQAAERELSIGVNNWAENIAVANMWKLLLEERRDYEVELINAAKSVIFSGLANEDFDISLEIWLPVTDKVFLAPYEERIDVHDAWFEGTGLGLVVPDYAEIDSIPELKEHAEAFEYQGNSTIIGIDSGSAIAGLTDRAIETYELPMEQMNSSGPAMMAALDTAIEEKQNMVVTLWKPHWAFAEYDLRFLEDPEGVFGDSESIHWFSRKDFASDAPWLTALLDAWQMNDETLGSLMARIEKVGDPEEGARVWIKEHQDLVNSWFEAADAAVE